MKYLLPFLFALFFLQSTQAQIINIPDANFKNALVNTNCVSLDSSLSINSDADTNDDGEIQVSEAEAVFSMAIYGNNINSMIGIEYFINLERLHCDFNSIGNLDVSSNINLEEISCDFNGMTSINTSNCINLKTLICSDNAITSFDLSDNINLVTLRFDRNAVEALDLSNNIMLDYIECSQNNILSLDLSYNVNLVGLRSDSNQFTSLDLSNNINLTTFTCRNSQLTSIDLSNNIELDWLALTNSSDLNSINIKNGNMVSVVYSNNFSGCPNLTTFCVDEEEVDQIQVVVDDNGYTNCSVVTDCSSLSTEEYNLNTIHIYPNPVAEKLYIASADFISSITFYNVNGCLVKEVYPANKRKLEIDIKDFSEGVYFLKVNSSIGAFSKKIVKN